jgi:hypothetical protein
MHYAVDIHPRGHVRFGFQGLKRGLTVPVNPEHHLVVAMRLPGFGYPDFFAFHPFIIHHSLKGTVHDDRLRQV